jgi:hypothetical protein
MKQIIHPLIASFIKRPCFFPAIIAILSGGIIYILFRTSEPLFFHWLNMAGFEHWLAAIRQHSLTYTPHLSEWMVYSLPNGLWAFAYAYVITSIWSGSRYWIRFLWMASIPVLVLGYEVFQYVGILPGTFCFQDLILGSLGLLTGIMAGLLIDKANNHERNVIP